MEDNKDIDKIEFPQRVYTTKIEKLLSHLGEDLKAEIDYTLVLSYRRGYLPITREKIKIGRQKFHAECNGTIRFSNHRWLNFDLLSDRERERNCFFYTAMRFDIEIDKTLEERKRSPTQHPEDIEEVRISLQRYFSKPEGGTDITYRLKSNCARPS